MRTPRRLGSLLAALALATVTLLVPTALIAPATAAPADSQLLIVLDASSSMLEPASDGGTRADAARGALLGVIETLDPEQRVGLRQFGATVVGLDDPASCTDSQLTVPIAADNRQALRDAATSYLPYGETPIAYALSEAGKDLGPQGQRTMLLISDGESNCDPDPCTVAGELAAQGIDLTLHVVGFDVSGAARDALVCIANAGGGQYFDVTDTSGLTSVLTKVSTRASQDFTLDGQEVLGAADAASAPALTPGTRYITYLPAPDAVMHYLVQRTIPGSTLWVSINSTAQLDAQDIGTQLYGDATTAQSCDSNFSFPTSWGSTWSLTALAIDSGTSAECTSSTASLLTIENVGDSPQATGAPAEVLIIEEPPLISTAGLPAVPEEVGAWIEPPATTPQPFLGGTSLSNTPQLTDGSYAFDLLPGETTLFHVPLDWGQSLQARASSEDSISFTLFSPNRYSMSYSLIDVADIDPDPSNAPRISAIRTKPVTYLARETGGSDEYVSLSGDYTVAVTRDVCAGCNQVPGPVPVTLDVSVTGEVSGMPAYVGGAATPPPPSPTDSPTTAAATPATDAPASPSSPPAKAEAEDGGIPLAIPIAVGIAGLALLGGGGWMLIRRRSAGATP